MKFIDTVLFQTLKLPAADVCVKGQPKEKKESKQLSATYSESCLTQQENASINLRLPNSKYLEVKFKKQILNLYLDKAVYFSRKQ